MTHALTFDIEEYFQVSAFEQVIKREQWDNWDSRVEYATGLILDLLGRYDTKATFFTLGIIADKHPALVRRIVDDGHELACHGYEHIRVTNLSPEGFLQDTERAKKSLEDISGTALRGYRAASFSIDSERFWAFEVLAKLGFSYSSSIYPVKHDLYGIPEASRFPFKPVESSLVEIPITTVKFCGNNVPAGGGGYFRLYPYLLTKFLLRQFQNEEGKSANMYFHPWEFDPAQPKPGGVPLKTKFRHYVNQKRSLARLERLLQDFRWSTMSDVYEKFI